MRVARRVAVLAALVAIWSPPAAHAVLDNGDRGPVLNAGNFVLRVTNAGILGNAFLAAGRSNDPSFEFPPGSGREAMNYTALWVGALDASNTAHVSGGPLLDWRPTPDPEDRVRIGESGRLGTARWIDDDADGRVDEETLNGRDDDGDGEIDEDLGFFSQQVAAADFVDDRPEAVQFVYPNGERHTALGLSVHQEVYAWAVPGYDDIAGIQYTITNHGTQTLRQLYVGLFADLDSRDRNDVAGHLNDRVLSLSYPSSTEGLGPKIGAPCRPPYCPDSVVGRVCCPRTCFTYLGQTLPAVVDGNPNSGLPAVAVVPLDHTIDPLALLEPFEATRAARAPGRVSFRSSVFTTQALAGQGGVPRVDGDRYAALAGTLPSSAEDIADDYAVLVSCGPFATLAPGQSISFAAALVVSDSPESLIVAMGRAAFIYDGTLLHNATPDSGAFGEFGEEVCLEPPPGVTFQIDPNCPDKFPIDARPPDLYQTYMHGHCIWTDADCSNCTGRGGRTTVVRWIDPGTLPPAPRVRIEPGDHAVRIGWDNRPEILFNAGITRSLDPHYSESRFLGYRVYRYADWRRRASLDPDRSRWALVAAAGFDTLTGERLLAGVTDSTVDYESILYRQRLYPPGRYTVADPDVLNGFDVAYAVTSVYELRFRGDDGILTVNRLESPIETSFVDRVVPHAVARADAKSVWVVPNPFKASADWDRTRTLGDQLTRHLDFMGLPRAACTIKIWTVAGDFVAILEHDGRNGDGEAPWDLVSRNGQEVESGIYLFTVDSALGHQVGRFVVIR
jgi:hypothetical protein